jgi:hypothetical protein
MFRKRPGIHKFVIEFNALALGAGLLAVAIGCSGGGASLPDGTGGTGGGPDTTPGMGGSGTNPGSGGRTQTTGTGGATAGVGGARGTGGTPGGCAGALVKCNNVCVDITGSQSNCGACGNACRTDQSCFLSACKCPTGAADCSGVCKDVMSTATNCGTCGNVCAAGATCIVGVCTCPVDQVACSGTCRAVNTDPQNCGKCGTICGAGTMCLFGACLDPTSLTCTPAAQVNTSAARDAFITLGKYWVNNNWWGASSGSGSNTIWSTCQQGDLIGWGTSWSWTGTSNQVKSYASTVLGWQFGWRLANSGLPIQLSSGKNINCGWSFNITQSGGAADVSFDMFAHTLAMAGTNDDPTDEIMIWLYRAGGAGPVGTLQTTVTIGGTSWDLYRGNNNRWNVFSYVRSANATSAVVNVMDHMRDLITRGWISSSKYLSSIQSGTEIFTGTGRLDTTGYYCRIQ